MGGLLVKVRKNITRGFHNLQNRRNGKAGNGDIPTEEDGPSFDFRPNDTYETLKKFEGSDCTLLRSDTTGNLFVVKTIKCTLPAASPNGASCGRRRPLPNEAKMLLSKLKKHHNIIRLFASEQDCTTPSLHCLYMEFCAGGDVWEQILKFDKLQIPSPPIFTLHVVIGVAYALAYLHHGLIHKPGHFYQKEQKHHPIIHGDIKPENLFLRWPGGRQCSMPDVVLGDFGMAQLEAESWGICGTQGYDSPEVEAVSELKDTDSAAFRRAVNARIMTCKSDMYQLGLVIYLLAAGRAYVTGSDPYFIELPEGYEEVTGFMAALTWLLQPCPRERPLCNGDMEEGLLFAVERFEDRRDRMFRRDGPLDEGVWNVSKWA